MPHPVTGIDHVYLLVNDLAASRTQFRKLGFTVSPLGLHSTAKGTANHTIMFRQDYLELMGIVTPTPDNAGRREMLARHGEGLHAIIGRIMSAEQAQAALAARGIRMHEPQSFSRPVKLPDGRETEAAFRTLDFMAEEVPIGSAFLCEHLTPGAVWVPELMEHPNGATGLAAIIAAVDDPEDVARHYARLFRSGRVCAVEGGMRVETGEASGETSAALLFLSREALAARYPEFDLDRPPVGGFAAVQFHVPDVSQAYAALETRGLSPVATQSGLAAGPEAASGAIIEFVT